MKSHQILLLILILVNISYSTQNLQGVKDCYIHIIESFKVGNYNSIEFQCRPFISQILNSNKSPMLQNPNSNTTQNYYFDQQSTIVDFDLAINELNGPKNNIQEVQMIFNNVIFDRVDYHYLKGLPQLKTLNIVFQNNQQITNVTGFEFLSDCPIIDTFKFSYDRSNANAIKNYSPLFNIETPQLKHFEFDLSGMSPYTVEFNSVPNLRSLKLITGRQLEKCYIQRLYKLQKLEVYSDHVIPFALYSLVQLWHYKQLKDLTIHLSSGGLEDKNLKYLANDLQKSNLKKLSLSVIDQFITYGDEEPRSLKDISPIADLLKSQKELEEISLDFSQNGIKNFKALKEGIFPNQNLTSIHINITGNPYSSEEYGRTQTKKMFDEKYDHKIPSYSFLD